jgi:hypothetical protein
MLEYMQYGFPVLVSPEASKGFVANGLTGLVLDPCNQETLRDAFDAILADYRGFWKYGAAGQRHLREAMASGGYADRVVDSIATIVAARQAAEKQHS